MEISIEVMLMCLSSRIKRVECGVECDVSMECSFQFKTNFVYPSILSKDEEDQRSSLSVRPE